MRGESESWNGIGGSQGKSKGWMAMRNMSESMCSGSRFMGGMSEPAMASIFKLSLGSVGWWVVLLVDIMESSKLMRFKPAGQRQDNMSIVPVLGV